MKKVTNTTKAVQRNPNAALLEMAVTGVSGFVEGMETRGQQELVHSDVLPREGSDDPAVLALGIIFGAPVEGDDLFREATLPAGWKKVGSDHAMWSYIHDDQGVERAAIFYKAAYYDRHAFIRASHKAGSS